MSLKPEELGIILLVLLAALWLLFKILRGFAVGVQSFIKVD